MPHRCLYYTPTSLLPQGTSHKANPEENSLDSLPKQKTKVLMENEINTSAIKHSFSDLPSAFHTAVIGSIQTSYPLPTEVKS